MSNVLLLTQQSLAVGFGSQPAPSHRAIGAGRDGVGLPLSGEPLSLHGGAIAELNLTLEGQPLEQATPLFSNLWSQPWQETQLTSPPVNVTATESSIDSLIPQRSLNGAQPLVGILDRGFDPSRSGLLGGQQIYLGYDWVEGDYNPLVTDGLSTSHGSQVLEAFTHNAPSNEVSSIWLGRAVGSGDWAASLVEFVATAKALGYENAVANLSFDLTEIQADGSLSPRAALNSNEISALEFAREQGVIVVAAAGNDNADLSALAQASQAFDNILTVGAAEQTGLEAHRASYSNYGEGLSLLAKIPDGLTGSPQGTSLAATQVTQAVQTLWQQHHQLSYRQVIDLLEGSATDLQMPGWDHETGHGLLNLSQALSDAGQATQEFSPTALTLPFPVTTPNPWDFTSNHPQQLERPLALEVGQVTPGDGATNIDTQASIRVQFASGAIDSTSLTRDSFKLVDDQGNAIAVSIGADVTGGVISLTPQGPLAPFSTYSVVITEALLNRQGEAATPFSTRFTTGAQGSSPAGLRFDNQQALSGESRFGISSIAVGPDGNVYASDILGNILRYNLDLSTGLATSTDIVFAQSGAQITGIAFDPNATATNLQLWITYAERDNTGFSGTISKLDLPVVSTGTATKQDYITGLPNSIGLPHQPNGIAFGSDGKLYQTVGGVATLGGTPNWAADESPLSAAVIVADVNSGSFPTHQTGNAVNVQTVGFDIDSDPTTQNYDPTAANAPVQVFATGLRNAYDLVWHSNGNLYSGINQNSIGGNVFTPESPDGSIPAINAQPNEILALIEEGNYYGHPNPSRGEYVLNGGNPTAGVDPGEVTEYPIGVQPDPNFDASLLFDTRSIGGTSPNGLTEYTGPGSLNGRLLVSFFSGARTIQSFELGTDGLVSATDALQDANGNNLQFNSPLDVAVHPSGRIYVADFGQSQGDPNNGQIRVLSPLPSPGVIITPTNGSTEISEAGMTDRYTVVLATQPDDAVTIALNADAELTSNVNTLIFTPANWNIPQTVTVAAVDDSDIEGPHRGRIRHSITSGSGDYGPELAIASLTANITDNDTLPVGPGVEIVETNGNTAVTEGGNRDSLSIRLTAEPSNEVILTLIPDGQLDLGPADSGTVDLTFTPTNWNQAQSVTVDAVDDSLIEGNHSGDLNYRIDSADELYEELTIATTLVSITDNDAPPPAGLILQPSGPGTTVAESGTLDRYQVRLASQPSAEVTVNLAVDRQLSLGDGQAPSLSFTASNWDIPQTVTLGAVDDSLVEGNHNGSITHGVTSGDSNYAVLDDEIFVVEVLDNDQAAVLIAPSGGSTDVTEGGSSDGYSVVLSSQPTANVTLTIGFGNGQDSSQSQDSSQLSLSSQTLTFTPSNWDRPQIVQVTAVDDNIRESAQVLSLTHTASSSDENYDGLAIAPLAVNLFDNDNGGTALFVAGSTNLSGSDLQARSILEDLGFEITVVDDGASTTADALGQDLVVISQSVFSNLVGSKFTNVEVPIVVWESFLYDDLGLANDFGFISGGASSLIVTNDSHPLAADLALGNQTIYDNAGEIGWGNPSSSAVIPIAHTGNTSQLGIFGYEAGAAMDIGIAPARRVAVNLWETPNGNGSDLFRAAIEWATGQDSPPPLPQPGTLAFGETRFSYGEAGNAINAITVERSEGSAGAVTAEVSLRYRPAGNGNADSADLVSSDPVTVSFADGDRSPKVVSLDFVDDLIEEGNEIFDLSLAVTSGGANLDPAATTATVNIIDNDAAGNIELTSNTFTVSESGGNASISLTRTGGNAGAQTVTLTPVGGTAAVGDDYDASPITVTFANGEAGEKTIVIPIQDDDLSEGNETVDLQLSGPPGTNLGNQTTATLSILDDDLPGITIIPSGSSTEVSEAGAVDRYQIVLTSQPTAEVAISLNFDNSQLSLSNSSLTFTPNNWDIPQTIQVGAIDDAVREGIALANISHSATSSDANYNSIAIPPLSVSIADNDGGGHALFVAGSTSLSGSDIQARAILEDLGYSITVVDDDASTTTDANGQDLVVISQSVFSNLVGTKFTNVEVPIVVWESFLYDDLGLANGIGFLASGSALTVTNNSHPLAADLALGSQSIYNNSGEIGWGSPTSPEVISIAHTGDPSQLGIFGYEAGAVMDGGIAPARRVAANLWETPNSNGEALFRAAIEWATGQEGPPPPPPTPQPGTLSLANTTFSYNEDSSPIRAITVERSGGSDGAVTANLNVSYRPAEAGAASAEDLVTSFPVTVSFADGDSTAKVIPLSVVDDFVEEGNEVFDVSLAIATGDASLDATQRSATVRIIDNDAAGTIGFTSGGFSINEGGGTAIIDLQRVGGSSGAQTVSVIPTAGTATAGEDYAATPITVTFADGEAGIKSFTLPIVDDRIAEASETIVFQLSGAPLSSQSQTTLTIVENDFPSVIVTPTGGNTRVSEAGLRDSYQLALASQPASEVTLSIDFDRSQLSLDNPTVTFTPANWDVPQTVAIAALDDDEIEGLQSLSLSHRATSLDSDYNGISINSLNLTVADNDQPEQRNALFVAGSTGLSGADAIARNLLISKGYSVTVVDDDFSQTSDANNQDLILISQTVQSTKVNTKFTNSAVPIIVWESFLYDDLGMANGVNFLESRSTINIADSSHPLAAGLPLGVTPINNFNGRIGWGDPTNNNAISIAHTGNPEQLVIFGYETGATMDRLTAPAKRIGLSFWDTPDTTGNNEALLAAAIDWATDASTPDAPTDSAPTDSAPTDSDPVPEVPPILNDIPSPQPGDTTNPSQAVTRTVDLNWQPLNEPGSGGRITSVSFNPSDPDHILMGGDMLGVGFSQDGGQSWQRPTGFTTSFEIEEFTWNPTNPEIVWAATREGPYLSQDGGQTWQAKRQGMPPEFTNGAWLTSPIHKVLYGTDGSLLAFGGNHSEFNAGYNSRFDNYGAVWESQDNGESWSIRGRINPSDTGSGYNIKSVSYAADGQTLYAAVESQGVYRSTDHGATWTAVNGGQLNDANDIAAHPSQPDTLWVSSESGLYKTTDGGTTWSAIRNGISPSHVNGTWQVIEVAPSNPDVLFAGNYSDLALYRSTDGGESWQLLENYPDTAFDEPITPHSLGIDPNNENRIIFGTYVTTYISEDQGESWVDATSQRADEAANEWKGRGFAGWVSTNIEWNPYQPNQTIFQGLDEGTLWLSDDLEGWRHVRDQPDGSLNNIDQFGGGWDVSFAADGQTIYTTLHQQLGDYEGRNRGIAKSLDGGQTWEYLDNQPGGIANKTDHAYEIHALPDNPDYLWVRVDQELWHSENAGDSWSRINLNGASVVDIAAPTDIVSTPDNALLYVATKSGVYQFKDNLWTNLGGIGNGEGVELEVDPHDASRLYLVNWNHESNGGLYQFENGVWTQLSNERYVRDVAVSPTDPDLLIAVTNQNPFKMSNDAPGLMISEDRGQTWSLDNDGLGVIRAQTVEFSPDGKQVVVGTTGGGFFISELARAS